MALRTGLLCFFLCVVAACLTAPQPVGASAAKHVPTPSVRQDFFPYALVTYRAQALEQIVTPRATLALAEPPLLIPPVPAACAGGFEIAPLLLVSTDPLYGFMSLQR